MLGCYIFILFVLFTTLLIFSLILTFNSGMAKKWANEAYNHAKENGDINSNSSE